MDAVNGVADSAEAAVGAGERPGGGLEVVARAAEGGVDVAGMTMGRRMRSSVSATVCHFTFFCSLGAVVF